MQRFQTCHSFKRSIVLNPRTAQIKPGDPWHGSKNAYVANRIRIQEQALKLCEMLYRADICYVIVIQVQDGQITQFLNEINILDLVVLIHRCQIQFREIP